MKLRALTGAPIVLNDNDLALLKMLDVQAKWIGVTSPGEVKIDHSIGQEDKLQAGFISASVLHTPGHTEGSVSSCPCSESMILSNEPPGRSVRPMLPAKRVSPAINFC